MPAVFHHVPFKIFFGAKTTQYPFINTCMARRFPRNGLVFPPHTRPRPSLNIIRGGDLPAGLANMRARDIELEDLPPPFRNAMSDNDNTVIITENETHIYSPTGILNDIIREIG